MFGHKWEKASGTVLSRTMTGRVAGLYGGNAFRFEYVVGLHGPGQRDGGAVRRVTVQDPRIKTYDWNPPVTGEVIALKIGADGRVVFDKSDPRRSFRKFKRLRQQGLA